MNKKLKFLVVLILAALAAYGIYYRPVNAFVGAITGEEIAIAVVGLIGFGIVIACFCGDTLVGVLVALVVTGWLIAGIITNHNRPHPYRDYEAVVVTVQQAQTMSQLCANLRPTWKNGDCVTQIESQNRALNFNLGAGERVFVDKSMTKGNETGYKKVAVKVGFRQKFATVKAACNTLRPTWKVTSCDQLVLQKNPQLLAHANRWIVNIPSTIPD